MASKNDKPRRPCNSCNGGKREGTCPMCGNRLLDPWEPGGPTPTCPTCGGRPPKVDCTACQGRGYFID